VPRVLAAALLFLHPEEYGVLLADAESTVTTVKLGSPASLGEIAVCLGSAPGETGWFRTLRNLNPQLSPRERIPAGEAIDLPTDVVDEFAAIWVDESPLLQTARVLHDAEYPDKPEVITYMVRRGDSLAAIAGKHRSSVAELSRLNGIRPPDYVIHPGQQLSVPGRQ
jgi:membrane-bound lytic murein transglycosylase D